MFVNLNHKNYVIYVALLSIISATITFIIPIWLLAETKSPFIVSIISSILVIISGSVTPFSGTLADRYAKIRLIKIGATVILISSLMLFIFNSFTFVLTLSAFLICLRMIGISINSPVNSSLLMDMITKEELPKAVPINQVTTQVSQTVSPLLGGLVIVLLGYHYAFLLETIVILFAIFFISKVKLSTEITKKNNRSFIDDLVNGFKMIFQSTKIFAFILVAACINILGASMMLAIQTHLVLSNVEQFWYGIVLASSPVGSIIGATLSRKIKWGSSLIYFAFLCVAMMAVLNIFMGVAINNLVLFTILFFLSGIFFGFSNVYFGILYRTEVPESQQGKFFGFLSSFMIISIPLGTVLNGYLLEIYQPGPIIIVLGIITFLIGSISSIYFKFLYINSK
ncbi:MFS transporter [Solibacillus sp. CAU 1738]|uniref:MFS transporter n=1 Tax=Solibacillus sp. CAU 1738 TaxID=3140363 RepID=UPI0032602748